MVLPPEIVNSLEQKHCLSFPDMIQETSQSYVKDRNLTSSHYMIKVQALETGWKQTVSPMIY